MANLKNTIINGFLRVIGKIYGVFQGPHIPFAFTETKLNVTASKYYKLFKIKAGFVGRIIMCCSRYGEAIDHIVYFDIHNTGTNKSAFGNASVIVSFFTAVSRFPFAKVSSSNNDMGLVYYADSSTSAIEVNAIYLDWCNDPSLIEYEFDGIGYSTIAGCGYSGTQYTPVKVTYS